MKMLGVYFFCFVLSFIQLTWGQTICSGSLSGTFADIDVNGGSCTLNGVTVTGSVSVSNGGSLVINGASQISGSVTADGAGNVEISGTTSVLGAVEFRNSASSAISVIGDSDITSLIVSNSGDVVIGGTVGSFSVLSSSAISVAGGNITGGGLLVEQGNGDITLCGASIGGSVSVIETTGSLLAQQSVSCAPSTIIGSVLIEKSTGDVRLTGASLSGGDLSIVEVMGTVELVSASLSDLSITGSSGPVTFDQVITDSDVIVNGLEGSFSISGSTFSGDVSVENNADVSITTSSFGNESVSLKLNSGPVTFSGNQEVSVSVEECDSVTFTDNTITGASLTKNTGGVSIVGNTIATLSCVDNIPAPTGSANIVTILASGQCASF